MCTFMSPMHLLSNPHSNYHLLRLTAPHTDSFTKNVYEASLVLKKSILNSEISQEKQEINERRRNEHTNRINY